MVIPTRSFTSTTTCSAYELVYMRMIRRGPQLAKVIAIADSIAKILELIKWYES